jgi:ribulose 1,5-bisphosphate synthetase/thiazole synthase
MKYFKLIKKINTHKIFNFNVQNIANKRFKAVINTNKFFLISFLIVLKLNLFAQTFEADVCVIGGGASGISAALQSARLGAKTVLIEETPWLGGMLTAAGVSCTDGNHWMPSGIWAEWRQKLYDYYGGPKEVATGWVSLTQFEPHIGAKIWADLAVAEPNLTVFQSTSFEKVFRSKNGQKWTIILRGPQNYRRLQSPNKIIQNIESQIVIDATELGDVAKMVGVKYRIGTDDPSETTGEEGVALKKSDIIQDLTYAAILKNYGKNNAPQIKKPANYDPSVFACSCANKCDKKEGLIDAQKMLDYGKLPNGKYMINWPKHGNDFYANVIESSPKERQKAYKLAKEKTLAFVYFIQNALGFKNLGLADDEFPTADKLPFMPYHRESRRINGLVTLSLGHISKPFDSDLYRTGIAVGDYPIDHHHAEYAGSVPVGNFPKVPSFNMPLGALIPKDIAHFIVAEKSISVSNIVNGTTRLQPSVILIGQAAGVLAALSAREKVSPNVVSIRRVQDVLLKNKAYLMPYFDVKPDNPQFSAIQRIGATGLLRGVGQPHLWANRTWFYPDSTVSSNDFFSNYFHFSGQPSGVRLTVDKPLSVEDIVETLALLSRENEEKNKASFVEKIGKNWTIWGLKNYDLKRPITRGELAVLLNETINPFEKEIDFEGNIKR